MKRRYAFGTVLAFALAICGGANGSASQDTYGQSTSKSKASEIVVMRSDLKATGAVYTPLATILLQS